MSMYLKWLIGTGIGCFLAGCAANGCAEQARPFSKEMETAKTLLAIYAAAKLAFIVLASYGLIELLSNAGL